MALLTDLKEEAELLQRLIDSLAKENPAMPLDQRVEYAGMYRVRLGRVQHMIDSIEQPRDHGGWEDR